MIRGCNSVRNVRCAFRWYMSGPKCTNKEKLEGKTIIVTGANTGIGKETAKELAKRGGKVILACRDIIKAEEAAQEIQSETGYIGKVKVMKLDLASMKSIRQFVDDFKKEEKQLHILVNNAGVMFVPYSQTEDGFELTMGVNHLGHFLLTNLLLDTLKSCAPSRIVTLSSSAHQLNKLDFADLMMKKSYNTYYAYGNSKLANILFTRELAHRLRDTSVTTYALHPGVVQTDLQRYISPILRILLRTSIALFGKSPVQGAQTSIYCCTEPSLHNCSGKYYSDCREAKPISKALDDETGRRLWSISEKLVGLAPSD